MIIGIITKKQDEEQQQIKIAHFAKSNGFAIERYLSEDCIDNTLEYGNVFSNPKITAVVICNIEQLGTDCYNLIISLKEKKINIYDIDEFKKKAELQLATLKWLNDQGLLEEYITNKTAKRILKEGIA